VLVVEEHFGHQVRYADKGCSVREQQRLVVNVTKVFFAVRVDVNSVVLYIIVYIFGVVVIVVVVVDSGNIRNIGISVLLKFCYFRFQFTILFS
jgi:hypothetical protein